MVADRAYCARRIEAGTYIQPSNDGKRRYVIAQFEDGRHYGLDRGPLIFKYWTFGELTEAKWREIERMSRYEDANIVIAELRDVACGGDYYDTKREAIAAALKHAERSA